MEASGEGGPLRGFERYGGGIALVLLLASLPCGILRAEAEGSSPFLGPSGIKPGMRGIARTVFAGNEPEDFAVEILGVVGGTRPKGDQILFRALGDTLARTGIVAGMSGSPVYVNGKLIGAIAFAYPFAKEAIGMITPIGEMLEGIGRVDEPPSPWMGVPSALYEPLRQEFVNRRADPETWDRLVPRSEGSAGAVPLVALWASGWSMEVEPLFERFARRVGLPLPVGGVGGGGESYPTGAGDPKPGDAVGMLLVTGDASLSAVGTLTYRDGDRIAAFGHPVFQGGAVDLPLTAAWIHAIVPSYNNSFKVGSAGPVIGAIRQDLRAGVTGVLGRIPPMLPVRIVLQGPAGRDVYHYRIARGTALEPTLLAWATSNSLMQHGWRTGEASVDAHLAIYYNGTETVSRRDRITTKSPSTEIAERLLAPIPLLLTNPFARVDLDSVALELSYTAGIHESILIDLWAERETVRPGESLSLAVRLKDHQAETREIRVKIPIPERWHGRTLLIIAGGAQDLTEWDQDRAPVLYEPKDIEGLVRLLSEFPDEGDLLVRIYGEEDGVVLGDREVGPLPGSIASVLGAKNKRGPARQAPNHRLEERRIDAGGSVTGGMAVRVTVE
jgi:hypothetical protein